MPEYQAASEEGSQDSNQKMLVKPRSFAYLTSTLIRWIFSDLLHYRT